uniref:ATP synthase complex subunit 8 n=1 Tax=Laudakia stellio stellio TaxID=246551 RepID=C0SPE9_9SAUR|nr:adenosine triphosphate subunit 8 [Stellagama stellio stellio]BAH56706.1 adenosine triphosphate subunit 8 [Stellagama stellio stellio]
MPQLETSNWYSTFLYTWLTLLLLMTKLMQIQFITPPKNLKQKPSLIKWQWPW